MQLNGLLNRADGVEQCAVALLTGFGDDAGCLNADKSFLTERSNVLLDCVRAHTNCSSYGFVTGIALIRFAVLAVEQVGVDGDFSGR